MNQTMDILTDFSVKVVHKVWKIYFFLNLFLKSWADQDLRSNFQENVQCEMCYKRMNLLFPRIKAIFVTTGKSIELNTISPNSYLVLS